MLAHFHAPLAETDTLIFNAATDTTARTGELTSFLEDRPGLTEDVEVGVLSGLGMALTEGSTSGTGRVEFEGFSTVDVRLGTLADRLCLQTTRHIEETDALHGKNSVTTISIASRASKD